MKKTVPLMPIDEVFGSQDGRKYKRPVADLNKWVEQLNKDKNFIPIDEKHNWHKGKGDVFSIVDKIYIDGKNIVADIVERGAEYANAFKENIDKYNSVSPVFVTSAGENGERLINRIQGLTLTDNPNIPSLEYNEVQEERTMALTEQDKKDIINGVVDELKKSQLSQEKNESGVTKQDLNEVVASINKKIDDANTQQATNAFLTKRNQSFDLLEKEGKLAKTERGLFEKTITSDELLAEMTKEFANRKPFVSSENPSGTPDNQAVEQDKNESDEYKKYKAELDRQFGIVDKNKKD